MDLDAYQRRLAELIRDVRIGDIVACAKMLEETKGNIYIIGNGGSAANAEHLANDLTKAAGLSAIALTGIATLTAYSNDSGYKESFFGPLSNIWTVNDTLIALSVSGTSPNIARAIFRLVGTRILLAGMVTEENQPIRCKADMFISVNDQDYGMVETVHQAIGHMITDLIREKRNE